MSMAAAQVLLLMLPGPGSWAARRWRSLMPSAIFTVALVAGFVAGTPYAVLDFSAFAADFSYDLTHLSGGHAVPLGRGWSAHAARSLPYGCGPALLAAAVAGILIGIRRYPRHTLIIAAFAAAYYAVIGSGYTVFFRHVMPLVPIVCLFAAIGTKHAADLPRRPRMGAADPSSSRLLGSLVLVVLVAFVAGPSAVTSVRMDLVLARTDTRVIAAEWLGPKLQPEHTLHDAGGDYARLDLRDRRYTNGASTRHSSLRCPDGMTPTGS